MIGWQGWAGKDKRLQTAADIGKEVGETKAAEPSARIAAPGSCASSFHTTKNAAMRGPRKPAVRSATFDPYVDAVFNIGQRVSKSATVRGIRKDENRPAAPGSVRSRSISSRADASESRERREGRSRPPMCFLSAGSAEDHKPKMYRKDRRREMQTEK